MYKTSCRSPVNIKILYCIKFFIFTGNIVTFVAIYLEIDCLKVLIHLKTYN